MNRFLLLTAAALSMLLTDTQDLFFTTAQAAPALRRIVTLKQPDGATLQAIPMGDEYMSFWKDAQTGRLLTQDAGTHYWREMTEAEIKETDTRWTEARRSATKRSASAYTIGGVTPIGEVRLPLVLVEFTDVKLTDNFGTVEYTDSLLNDLDFDRVAYTYKENDYHTGSIRKYWNIQSLGQFDPQFDVLGKISLSKAMSQYGKESGSNHDINISGLLTEVVDTLKAKGWMDNAAQYDNNHDGVVDCIYIIYARFGQNETGEGDQIWAKNTTGHIYTMPDGTKTNLFLLSPELFGASSGIVVPNIGVFTHEFGHSIGLPDFYSTNASTASQCYGMDSWSLMDQGEYSGRGQIPGCLTTHERMFLGWLEPTAIVNDTRDTLNLFASTGDARIFRNPENPDEYITIENHQPENPWEITWGNSAYFSPHRHEGLLITYVSYDANLWGRNAPNNDPDYQRCGPVSADGEKQLFTNFSTKEERNAWLNNLSSDIYPGLSNVKKLNSENPLFHWHNGDTIAFNINNIEQLSDRRIVLTIGAPSTSSLHGVTDTRTQGKAVKRLKNGQIYIEKDGAYYDLLGRKVSFM